MPQVQPVEHADDDEHRLVAARQRLEPAGDVHGSGGRAVGGRGRAARRGRGRLGEHLVRVERARDRAAHGRHAPVRADRQHERRVADLERRLRRRDQALARAAAPRRP